MFGTGIGKAIFSTRPRSDDDKSDKKEGTPSDKEVKKPESQAEGQNGVLPGVDTPKPEADKPKSASKDKSQEDKKMKSEHSDKKNSSKSDKFSNKRSGIVPGTFGRNFLGRRGNLSKASSLSSSIDSDFSSSEEDQKSANSDKIILKKATTTMPPFSKSQKKSRSSKISRQEEGHDMPPCPKNCQCDCYEKFELTFTKEGEGAAYCILVAIKEYIEYANKCDDKEGCGCKGGSENSQGDHDGDDNKCKKKRVCCDTVVKRFSYEGSPNCPLVKLCGEMCSEVAKTIRDYICEQGGIITSFTMEAMRKLPRHEDHDHDSHGHVVHGGFHDVMWSVGAGVVLGAVAFVLTKNTYYFILVLGTAILLSLTGMCWWWIVLALLLLAVIFWLVSRTSTGAAISTM